MREATVTYTPNLHRSDRAGMTLIEMMVALAIFAVVTTVVIGFLTGSRRTYDSTSNRAHYQQSARALLSLMTRELRSTGCDPAEVGLEGTLGTNPDEDIRYVWNSATAELQRVTTAGTIVVLRAVQLVQFRYFAADGTPLTSTPLSAADRARVRFMNIDLDGELPDGEPVSYQTSIFLRNG